MTHKFLLVGLLIFSLFSCKSEGVWIEFEDPIFITYLHDHCDIPITEEGRIDMDDEPTRAALGRITDLNLDRMNCSNLIGIRHLVSLVNLSCTHNKLTSLDVSELNRLESLHCFDNSIKTLNIKECAKLRVFDCRNNQIEKLDLKGQTALERLICSGNRLDRLNIRECKSLIDLACYNQTDDKNNIRKLTLTLPPDLQKLWDSRWKTWNPDVTVIVEE